MSLRDRVRRPTSRQDEDAAQDDGLHLTFDADGANFSMTRKAFAELSRGRGPRAAQEQLIVLEMLAEQGAAVPIANGYCLTSVDTVRLDTDEREILGLPPAFPGLFTAEVTGNTTSPRFRVTIHAEMEGRRVPFRRSGPTVTIGTSTRHLLTPRSLRVLEDMEHHAAIPAAERTEAHNLRLVASLRSAQDDATETDRLHLSLGHLDAFEVLVPDRVGLIATPEHDGSLTLAPDLGVDPDLLDERYGQLDNAVEAGVLRVGDQLVLLEERQLRGVREVRRRRRVPTAHARDFLHAPGSFVDPDLVDVDISFGVRVAGVGIVIPQTFAEASESGIAWFGDEPVVHPTAVLATLITDLPRLEQVERSIELARETGAATVAVGQDLVDVADPTETNQILSETRQRLEAEPLPTAAPTDPTTPADESGVVPVGMWVVEPADQATTIQQRVAAASAPPIDITALLRQPFPHQREGIDWLIDLLTSAVEADRNDPGRVQGALLADDMGLGKTYMTLAALAHYCSGAMTPGVAARPCLAVVPLSLIENWESEIAETFPTPPFERVVVLQGERDLARFRRDGAGRETRADAAALNADGLLPEEEIRLSLRVGPEYGDQRLDAPGRLVLTTFETLASYQLSLAQVDWGVVVLDEAQNVKNPETLRSRAARGLKAQFKLLATGTPVENSLRDFWCLMDTAQPGLLGGWSDFRSTWVTPMAEADHGERQRLGHELRSVVGRSMLRRTKEDHLSDLPPKTVHGPWVTDGVMLRADLGVRMPIPQQTAYDDVLGAYRALGPQRPPGAALGTVQRLRSVSLHPDTASEHEIPADSAALMRSARMLAAVRVLDEIRPRGEKAIVFVIDRKVQVRLAAWLTERYRLPVRVVNGDTKATSRGTAPSRKRLIDEFQAAPGFGVIIMSPLAVGVGLTVVGANHAIHLERHWNPAKEAQATDRIYRIGQRRPVHVYLPAALHPQITSFDQNLDQLLRQKTQLRDVLVVPEAVTDADLVEALGLDTSA